MPKNVVNKLKQYHVFSLVCGLTILLLCTIQIPKQDDIPLFPNFDKFVHFTMYFGLCLCYLYETVNYKAGNKKQVLGLIGRALMISALLGGAIEFIQEFMTSYRSADFSDWVADMAGALSACLMVGLSRLAFR